MKKRVGRIVACFLILSLCALSALADSVPQEVLTGAESVVRIAAEFEDEYFAGSGFVIAKDSGGVYVATNWHVVEGEPESIYIWVGENETMDAEIYARSVQRDLCILKLPKALQMDILTLSDSAQKGAAVYAVGFPGAADYLSDTEAHTAEEATITDGIISAVRQATIVEDGDTVALLQVSAAINSGNSGGPLFNADGAVVGINTYSIYDSQGVFGAIAIDELIDLMEDHGLTPMVEVRMNMTDIYVLLAGAVILVIALLAVICAARRRKRKAAPHHLDADAKRRAAVSDSQRYFDEDYGYSAENPFVVSSVQMEGCYLAAFRTEAGEAFTWERQLRGESYGVDCYKLFINGVFDREIFFNPHGNNSEQLPNGLFLDNDTFEAVQQGISVERLLVQRAAAEQAKQKKKKRVRAVRRSIAAVLAVAILAGAGWCAYTYGYPWAKYTLAARYLEGEKTEQAMELFGELGSYKDSKAQVLKCRYDLACDLMDAGDYEGAIAAFEALGTYEDAAEQIKQAKYLQAMEVFEKGEYISAQELFKQIEEYDFATEMVKECELQMVLKAIKNGEYDEARERLVVIDEYKEKTDELARCYYDLMQSAIECEKWERAYHDLCAVVQHDVNGVIDISPYLFDVPLKYSEWLMEQKVSRLCDIAVQVLSESVERTKRYGKVDISNKMEDVLKQTRYDAGRINFNDKKYETSMKHFKDLAYRDSEQWWLEATYQYVVEIRNNSRVTWNFAKYLHKTETESRRIYNYVKILAEKNYKDSAMMFKEICVE